MNYSSIQPTYVVKQKLYVDKNTIFVVLPDTNLQIWNEIYKTNLLLSNCVGLVCPNKIFTIGNKKFNGKAHYLEVKKRLMALNDKKIGKKIKVLTTFPQKKDDVVSSKTNRFFFYDISMWSQAFNYLLQHYSEKIVAKFLFKELEQTFNRLKTSNPSYNVDFMMLIKDQQGQLFNFIKNIRAVVKAEEFKKINFFDDFTTISDCQNVLFPIICKDKGEIKIIISNLIKMEKYVEIETKAEEMSKEETIKIEDNEPNKTPSIISNLIKNLATSKLIVTPNKEKDEIKLSVNQDELRKFLKVYKIDDPDIVANVKSALDEYINTHKDKLTQDEAEHIVLKAINYSLYGTEEIKEEYLERPSLLINKLKEIDTYKVGLNIPNVKKSIVQPNNIIDLKYTTGQTRQKFEFENAIHNNVKKLFESLETVNSENPIKIKKIEWDIQDNNSDRFINYKVTLQNVNGGKKNPYTVQLKVPSPVNEKYFKLHNNYYIMSTQQFLRPVTKTDKNEVRIISNYGIVRVGLANVKYNPSDIEEICKYIQVKYPKLIKELTDEHCQFSDNSTIYFAGEILYESQNLTVILDDDTGSLINKETNEEINQGRFEFLYETVLNKIQVQNPEDNLTKTKKSIPYIWIYLGAIKMPLILYLWSRKGLLSALNSYGIDYELVDKKNSNTNIQTKDGKFLSIKPKNIKEQLIVNGLLNLKLKNQIENLDNPQEIFPYIAENYGSRANNLISLLSENFADPITKELLQFEDLPSDLVTLSSTTAVDQLLNKKIDSLADLKIYRSRLSEIILNIMYRQIKMAQNAYKMKVDSGDDTASLYLDTDYVINNLLTDAGVLQNVSPVSPLNEIMQSSRVIKSGKGGKYATSYGNIC